MKSLFFRFFFSFSFVSVLTLAIGCSSTSTSTATTTEDSGTESAVTVSSLDEIPNMDAMLTGAATTTSLSLLRYVTSGTPPALKDITSVTAPGLFWPSESVNGNLIADINEGTVDPTASQVIDDFWNGQGACYFGQGVGYTMQAIQQTGTSVCYLKNMPNVTGIVGDVEDLAPTAATRIVKVNATLPESEEGIEEEMSVFVRVYGTDEIGASQIDYDMWFCGSDPSSTPSGYEKVRINLETGAFTDTMASTDFGSFTAEAVATLTETSDGTVVFDSTTNNTFRFTQEALGLFGFNYKADLTVTGDAVTIKERNVFVDEVGDENSDKRYADAVYAGAGDSVAFVSGAYLEQWTGPAGEENVQKGAVEYRDVAYIVDETLASFDLLSDTTFADDSFYSGATSTIVADPEILAGISDFSCAVTADSELTIGVDSIIELDVLCQQTFNDMNFCDSTAIQNARGAIIGGE